MIDRQEIEQEEMLAAVIDSAMYRVRTSTIGEVVAVDMAKNTVDVQPLIMRRIRGGSPEPLPVVRDVPIKFYGAGGFVITFIPEAGDVCELVVSDRSLANWKQKGGVVDPAAKHHHNMTDCTAYFGLNDYGSAIESVSAGMDIRTRDGTTGVKVTSDEIEFRQGGTLIATMNGTGVTFHVPIIDNNATSTVGGVVVKTHPHSGVTSGASNSGPPV